MRARIFTLRFSPTLSAFDDSALQDFVRDKEVLSLREHFFVVHEVPHLCCVLAWQELPVSVAAMQAVRATAPGRSHAEASRRGADALAALGEGDRILFQTLRRWRSEAAQREGVPPYVVLTNRQLLLVVQGKPSTRNALAQLEGLGPAKVERYGEALLAVLHGQPTTERAAPAPGAPSEPTP